MFHMAQHGSYCISLQDMHSTDDDHALYFIVSVVFWNTLHTSKVLITSITI